MVKQLSSIDSGSANPPYWNVYSSNVFSFDMKVARKPLKCVSIEKELFSTQW